MTDQSTNNAPLAPVSKKGIGGWMLFDWAAQPFFTVMTTFIFAPYVVSRMVEDHAYGQAMWGYGITVAGIVIAILSPILGSIADKTGPRKPWILFFAVIKITCLALLWFAAPGSNILWVIALFSLATVAAEFSIVFNDSMMPSLVSKERMGKISNLAWGLGYAGGMVVLILVIALMAGDVQTGKTIIGLSPILGLDPALGEADRAAGPLSALWYFVFILPMFLFTPDRGEKQALKKAVHHGLLELKATLQQARARKGLFHFLVARMVYQDGVNALLAFGGLYAAGLFGWVTTEIGIYGIVLNISATFGCFIAAKLDTAFGSKWVVVAAILILIFATVGITSTDVDYSLFGLLSFSAVDTGGLFATGAEKAFIFFGLFIGLAFGPIQASSRSYLARSVSKEEAGQFFGLYAFCGRATSFIAPFLVSTVTLAVSPKAGMATILLFFIVGLIAIVTAPYPATKERE